MSSYAITTNLFAHSEKRRNVRNIHLKNVLILTDKNDFPRYQVRLGLRDGIAMRYSVDFMYTRMSSCTSRGGIFNRVALFGTSSFIEADYVFMMISETVHAVKDKWTCHEVKAFMMNLRVKMNKQSTGIRCLNIFHEVHNILFILWLEIYGPDMSFVFPQDMRANTILSFFEEVMRKEGRVSTIYKFKDSHVRMNNRQHVDIKEMLYLLPLLGTVITDSESIPIQSHDELKETWQCDEELTMDTGTQTEEDTAQTPVQQTVIMSPLVLAATAATEPEPLEPYLYNDPCGMCGETGLCSCLWRPGESINYPDFTQQMDPDAFLTFPDDNLMF